jgi:homoserine/homoserine lactone efflux protein
MCATSLAARYGLRSALIGIAGLQLAHVVFFVCVACGLAALLATAGTAFTVLRIIGALYLLYLGIRIIASSFRLTAREQVVGQLAPSRHHLLLQGFAIQVTNPKALLFMSALLPQFIRAEQSVAWQLGILLIVTIAVDTLVLSGYACFALRGAEWFRSAGITAWLERIFGAALILFGLRLFAARK